MKALEELFDLLKVRASTEEELAKKVLSAAEEETLERNGSVEGANTWINPSPFYDINPSRRTEEGEKKAEENGGETEKKSQENSKKANSARTQGHIGIFREHGIIFKDEDQQHPRADVDPRIQRFHNFGDVDTPDCPNFDNNQRRTGEHASSLLQNSGGASGSNSRHTFEDVYQPLSRKSSCKNCRIISGGQGGSRQFDIGSGAEEDLAKLFREAKEWGYKLVKIEEEGEKKEKKEVKKTETKEKKTKVLYVLGTGDFTSWRYPHQTSRDELSLGDLKDYYKNLLREHLEVRRRSPAHPVSSKEADEVAEAYTNRQDLYRDWEFLLTKETNKQSKNGKRLWQVDYRELSEPRQGYFRKIFKETEILKFLTEISQE